MTTTSLLPSPKSVIEGRRLCAEMRFLRDEIRRARELLRTTIHVMNFDVRRATESDSKTFGFAIEDSKRKVN